MADTSFRRFYHQFEFAALTGGLTASNVALLETALRALTLTVPIGSVSLVGSGAAVVVEWEALPVAADLAAVDAAVAAFTGGTTTSSPFEYNSFAASTTTSNTHQTKLDNTTPPLDAGTYQVIWNSTLRMQAVAANTGVEGKAAITRSDGVNVTQIDSWDLAQGHAFNGAITFQVQAGQTIRSVLTFARLGASNTAEISGARITVDKIS